MESQFIALLVLSYVSVFSQAPLLVLDDRFTQSTHQFKQCYFQLLSNPQCSEIWPPKYLNYRCMSLHLEINFVRFIPHSFFELHIEFWKYFHSLILCSAGRDCYEKVGCYIFCQIALVPFNVAKVFYIGSHMDIQVTVPNHILSSERYLWALCCFIILP